VKILYSEKKREGHVCRWPGTLVLSRSPPYDLATCMLRQQSGGCCCLSCGFHQSVTRQTFPYLFHKVKKVDPSGFLPCQTPLKKKKKKKKKKRKKERKKERERKDITRVSVNMKSLRWMEPFIQNMDYNQFLIWVRIN
jgi:hypothetical protein